MSLENRNDFIISALARRLDRGKEGRKGTFPARFSRQDSLKSDARKKKKKMHNIKENGAEKVHATVLIYYEKNEKNIEKPK